MTAFTPHETGRGLPRREALLKVTGRAPYSAEVGPAQGVHDAWHAALVLSSIASGRVTAVDAAQALAQPGIVAVLDHTNAPRLAGDDDEHLVLQSERIEFRGQIVAIVIAESSEAAREGARLVRVAQEATAARTRFDLDAEFEAEREPHGDDAARTLASLSGAAHVVDATYSTPPEHNNPMEPHAIVARWNDSPGGGPQLEAWLSTQGATGAAKTLATTFGIDADQVRVRGEYVGGGFGSKGVVHAPDVAGALAARAHPGRWVRLTVTRQQMFVLTGYRAPTIERIRLGADADGRLLALDMTAYTQVSTVKQFIEGATGVPAMMYGGERRTLRQKVATLNVPVTSWMRAPGEMPGAHALECAMDELARACDLDPVELRIRNDVATDPATGKPFNGRRLVDCLRLGAMRFGWSERQAEPGTTRDGEWLVGLGVASATYPALMQRGSETSIEALGSGRYRVRMGSADIGQGAWTVLGQIAADALGVGIDDIDLQIGDSAGPPATVAGGSSGTASWGASIIGAAQAFREKFGDDPGQGDELRAGGTRPEEYKKHAMHSFGAHFVQARVHAVTGEVRVARMLGVFSVGRVLNPMLVRSQFIGGMVMGIGAALHEAGVRDELGHVATGDLASYHVPTHADIADIDAIWLDEVDPLMGPLGARGVGEIGIVGASAAVANAVFDATGIRVRDLPITPATLVPGLTGLTGR
ncbi:xanthine dehydrogenase YagR molybdenum-binding subunit [Kineosphaera limosa]|uniref:Putative oxidoreductase molybdopterin-binding subunit n=1 Tax=Kineosphaera limosa NBRC 100340 TaxID=1184609 RepID=K6WST4_9MICO|nr:xanthine dehydrogenase family protein molybdopterin-binding subunit [Kineosphaera limosa]NYE00297.1 xanthine dehydrogenase YagR molybdenum-binding subunit [Kineosphaera limosa]GAB96876.1 putative oxidoreductase molybdopterin-binding subunit [Kineosphaera limosa NBRC 100340]